MKRLIAGLAVIYLATVPVIRSSYIRGWHGTYCGLYRRQVGS
jgi:hypothetical protein